MHHSLDICFDVAKKLSDPQTTIKLLNDKIENGQYPKIQWPDVSLAWGLSGIACFYAMMHLNFENDGWDVIAHKYLENIKKKLELITYYSPSLFSGLAGICLSVLFCSNKGNRYKKFLSTLDRILIEEIERTFLKEVNRYMDPEVPVPSHFYNLANGLGGIISYLLHRDDLKQITIRCVESLVKVLSTTKCIDSRQVFPWYIQPDFNEIDESNPTMRDGYYRLEVPYGLPGVVGVLSKAANIGFKSIGLLELISNATEWIKSQQVMKNGQLNWNRFVPLDPSLIIPEAIDDTFGNNWLKGAPGISRCLYIASGVLKNPDLAKFSESVFLEQVRSSFDQKKIIDTSFTLGRAGMLSLTYQMACDTEKPLFFKLANAIETDLKLCYSPHHEFGFQSLAFINEEEPQWIDNPSLCNGAVGISLSLLQTQGRVKMPWNEIFLS